MKAIVLLNSSAGQFAATNDTHEKQAVAGALAAAGIDADVRQVPSESLAAEAKAAAESSVDLLIAGGGDGTISTVAGELVGKSMPLGILPLGTLNHFAKDLGIPLDIAGAARVIAAGHIGSVDVVDLNGRAFINNSSLGIYARVVLDREASRSRHKLNKWLALTIAVIKAFHRFPLLRVQLVIEGNAVSRKTPLVFVGNNEYQLDLLNVGKRQHLNRGELSLYVVNAQNRWGVLKVTLRALLGKLVQSRDFDLLRVPSCTIESRRHRLHVAADGEILTLKPPLHYQVRAGALRVCLPEIPVTQLQKKQ